MSKAVDDLIAASKKQTTVIAGAVTAIKGFGEMVLDAKDDPVRIEQVVAQMNENADALGQAVATVPGVNTGVTPPTSNPPQPSGLLSFLPTSGAVGSSVDLNNVDDASNVSNVTLSGTPCTFFSAAPNHLTVTVPTGAASGIFAVTTPNGTKLSVDSFTVTP